VDACGASVGGDGVWGDSAAADDAGRDVIGGGLEVPGSRANLHALRRMPMRALAGDAGVTAADGRMG
jgi:hypothetical protein